MMDDPRKPQAAPLEKEGGDRDVSTGAGQTAPPPPGPGGMAGEADPARRDGERRGGMEGEG